MPTSVIRQHTQALILQLREQAKVHAAFETAQGLARSVTKEMFRVYSLRRPRYLTRWRYGINHVAVTKHYTAAALYGTVALGKKPPTPLPCG